MAHDHHGLALGNLGQLFGGHGLGAPGPVLSDECELVSVWHECGDIMQHKVDATRREQRCVEV